MPTPAPKTPAAVLTCNLSGCRRWIQRKRSELVVKKLLNLLRRGSIDGKGSDGGASCSATLALLPTSLPPPARCVRRQARAGDR